MYKVKTSVPKASSQASLPDMHCLRRFPNAARVLVFNFGASQVLLPNKDLVGGFDKAYLAWLCCFCNVPALSISGVETARMGGEGSEMRAGSTGVLTTEETNLSISISISISPSSRQPNDGSQVETIVVTVASGEECAWAVIFVGTPNPDGIFAVTCSV